MKILNNFFFLGLCLFSAACGTTGSGARQEGDESVQFGQYKAKWARIPAMKPQVPAGLTPLIFTYHFAEAFPREPGVTDELLQARADELDMPVSDMVSVIYGRHPYIHPSGQLASCTMAAVEKGWCGKKLGLSIEQRVQIAKQLLDMTEECRWVGFDPAYNRRASRSLGAEASILNIAADCS